MARTTPYGAFNFTVNLGGRDPDSPLGGFSDVSGLSTEFTMAEYRAGNDPENHVQKFAQMHKSGEVTLKRGMVKSDDFWEWIRQARTQGPAARRDVVITLRDEAGRPVQGWTLHGVTPMKYTGPTLAAKAGADVAMEELVLASEGFDINILG